MSDLEAGNEQPVTDSHPSPRMKQQDRTTECVKLEEHVFSVKKRFLAMYKKAHAGHIGSSLSCAEILVFLKFAWMRDDDTFIFSKGHAAASFSSCFLAASMCSPFP